jgi:NAD dependent epimerase/dehydratase
VVPEKGKESFWQDRSTLVTGGCGFIGSHLVEALLDRGAYVRVLDSYNSTSHRGSLESVQHPRLEVHLGDVADPHLTRRLAEGVDTIFHLAALIGIPYSYVAPAHYVHTNVNGAIAILEAARRERVRRVVHTSTSETYGTAQFQPMDESHPLVAQSPYAATKIAADQLAGSYHRSFDVPVAVLRPFNTFGPRQSLRAILPTLMSQALFAHEIAVGSLDPIRDMTYVSDTVEAFLELAATDGVEGEVYNIGSGVGRSIREMLELVEEVAAVDKPVRQVQERFRPEKSEVAALVCDYSKAQAMFGWKPSVSFKDGLERLRASLIQRSLSELDRYHV